MRKKIVNTEAFNQSTLKLSEEHMTYRQARIILLCLSIAKRFVFNFNKCMPIAALRHIINVAVILFIGLCLPNVSFAENGCTADGGSHTCLPVMAPEVDIDWRYYYHPPFITPPEGRSSPEEAVEDYIQYIDVRNKPDFVAVDDISVLNENIIERFFYNNEPIRKNIGYALSFKYQNESGVYYGGAKISILATKKTRSWRCPAATQIVDIIPKPSSPAAPPFLCVIKNPNRSSCISGDAQVGNPCSVATGRKVDIAVDWVSHNSPLRVIRFYDSTMLGGKTWAFNYRAKIEFGRIISGYLDIVPLLQGETIGMAVLHRQNGNRILAQSFFTDNTIAQNTGWFVDRDLSLQLHGDGLPMQIYNVKTGVTEHYEWAKGLGENAVPTVVLSRIDYPNDDFITLDYNDSGQLITATDNREQQLHYHYDVNGNMVMVELPDGKSITYDYDSFYRLTAVQRPGYGIKRYQYGDGNQLLTGIVDENGKQYANYEYDGKNRAILTQHAGAAQRNQLEYASYRNAVINEYDNKVDYYFKKVQGIKRVTHIKFDWQHYKKFKYDQAGNIIEYNENGIISKYTYDETRNLRTSEVRAFGTPESTITLITWHKTLPVITQLIEGRATEEGQLAQALRTTIYDYDHRGNVLSTTVTDNQTNESRRWTATYDGHNQPLSNSNPLGQTQYWQYDGNGNVTKHTDYQGRVTLYEDYNPDGQPRRFINPAGQVSEITYDEAGRVIESTITIVSPLDAVQTATTTYKYDKAGQLLQVNLPDGSIVTYRYDDAHRLIGMTDNFGNHISYTLNSAGKVVAAIGYDPDNQLANSSQYSFNHLGQLEGYKGNNGQSETYRYRKGFLHDMHDGLTHGRYYEHDNLGRLISESIHSDKVTYSYDGLSNLTTVTDAEGNTTTYTYNAFGDLLSEYSPDSGLATYAYSNGLLTQQTDAAGRIQHYIYDNKKRLIRITDANQNTISQYSYDYLGRISRLSNVPASISTDYTYDSANRVIGKTQTINGKVLSTTYRYTAGGLLEHTQLPSGRMVDYQYQNGVLRGIAVTNAGSITQLIDNVTFSPNGITGYRWSQTGQLVGYEYDLDGRLTNITDVALFRSYTYDVVNRITGLSDDYANINQTFTYDRADRLTEQDLGEDKWQYTYDKNGNRTLQRENNASTDIPIMLGSNRLANVIYDASGRTLDDGLRQYGYNSAGRIADITHAGIRQTNEYNGLGQRVKKSNGTDTTIFNYDEQGKLIGEYTADNELIREYVYLGSQPIALISRQRPGEVLYIHSDHLGTPRAVTDKAGQMLWQWEGDAFGTTAPQIEAVELPLRMAGQYHDSETGLFYNYYRYYDPVTGRYLRSDPIGLNGGMNTYAYVGGNPVMFVDPLGLYTLGDARQSLKQRGVAPKDDRYFRGEKIGHKYSKQQIFDEWIRLERKRIKDDDWTKKLPNCPKTLSGCVGEAWEKPSNSIKIKWFHPGASWEVRSKSFSGHSTQCTYNKKGVLLVEPPAAGSADFKACTNPPWCGEHIDHDVIPFNLADDLDRIDDYYDVRPVK